MEAKHTIQYFDFTNIKHKHFFAGLLNTAQHNFDLSLRELAKRIHNKDTTKGLITIAFNNSVSESDFKARTNYLSESLAFIKLMNYENRAEFRDTLLVLYNTIDGLRNYYTHYKRDKITIDESVYKLLDYLLLTSAKEVKINRAKSEEYKKYLSIKYQDEFEEIIDESNKKIEEDNALLKKGERKTGLIKPQDEVNHVLNKVFRSFLYKNDKGEDELRDNASSKNKEDTDLSTYGFVQLLALFLNKKQTESLLSYTKYLKDTRKLKFVTSRWTLTFLCYKDIKRLFKSDYSNDSLLLQMISELTKCPNEIYRQLTPDKKQEFIEDINEYYKDTISFEGTNEQALVSHEVIQKRYANRFSYFTIRFLDEIIDFPTLKFHVNLGKFNHDTTKKKFSNAIETERSILEKITVFTKLSTATNNKKDYFSKPENKELENDWLEFPMPSYQFNKNNIGIWLSIDKKSGESDAPEERENSKLSKYKIAEKLLLKNTIRKPIAFLSFNELPALLYSLLIEKKTPIEIEKIIQSKIIEQRKLISSFDKTKIISNKRLPKKLIRASHLDSTTDVKKLEKDIKTEISKDPIGDIRKHYKKEIKNVNEFTNSEKGKVTTWLADDIKRFTSKETRENWKGYQYAEFQALLSFYDINKDKPKSFLEKDLNYDYKKDNSFNGLNFNLKTLFDFYNSYLKNRREYLNNLLKEIESSKDEIHEKVFIGFTKRLYEIKPIDIQKNVFLKKIPLNLPRGIFDDKPTSYDKGGKDNTEIASWFTLSSKAENAQLYYCFPKVYSYPTTKLKWDNRKRRKIQKSSIATQLISPKERLKQQYLKDLPKTVQVEIYKNEKSIRKIMREDFFILEMVKHLLKKSSIKGLDKLQLKDVFLTKEEKNRRIVESLKQSQRVKGDKMENVVNDSYILSQQVAISILNDKIIDTVQIKTIGKLRRLEEDKRVRQLIEYFPDKPSWTVLEIQSEIDDYDRVRKFEFFSSVHVLEKLIYKDAKKNNAKEGLLQNNNHNFRKYLSYYYLNEDRDAFNSLPNFDTITIDNPSIKSEWYRLYLLVKIRNKFSHNQLLSKVDFDSLKEIISMNSGEKIAAFLNRAFDKLIIVK